MLLAHLLAHWHDRGDRLGAPRAARSATAADDAAEDGDEKEATDAAGNADDEIAVVVDPGADFFGGVGAFALTLGE